MIVKMKDTGDEVHVSDEIARHLFEDDRATPVDARFVEVAVVDRRPDRETR